MDQHRLVVNSRGEGTLVHVDECAPERTPGGRVPRPGEGTLRCEFARALLRTRLNWQPGTYEVEIGDDGELRVLRVVR